MLHHDQTKMIPSEFFCAANEGRFIDDNMMDDLIIVNSDQHLSIDNSKQMMHQNFMGDDYFVSYGNYGGQNSQYSFHTLQPSSQQYQFGGQGPSYMNSALQPTTNYSPKLITRTPSINSSIGSSSPSSVSSTLNSNNHELEANKNDPAEIAKKKSLAGQKLTNEEMQLLIKDRQRKDNHNMIERRRRFNINDRIKELGQLLPKSGEYDNKQNKGSILKASVDFIQTIKKENEELRKRDEFNKYVLQLNKKLCNRVKELESICCSNGINTSQTLNYGNQILDGSLNQINSRELSVDLSLGFDDNIELYNQSQNVMEIPNLNLEDNYFSDAVSSNKAVKQKRVRHSNKKSDAKREKKDVKVPKLEPISPKEKNQTDGLDEKSSPLITSTSYIKLMADNSKDPVLTSVSSPPHSPNKQNSTDYSNKSLNENGEITNQMSVSIPCMVNVRNDCF